MLEKIIKDYFSFSSRERVAVLVLVLLIIIVVLLPYIFPGHSKEWDKVQIKNLRLQTVQLQNIRDTNEFTSSKRNTFSYSRLRESSFEHNLSNERSPQKVELFYFDPNNLSGEGWKKLGLRDKTVSIIHNYISKGGKFRTGEDLKRIYGLAEEDAERLMPYVRITSLDIRPKQQYQESAYYKDRRDDGRSRYKEPISSKPIDLNETDTSELIALPGIGNKLAERILRFREKLGGFYSVDQVSEVYGLPDSTFQKIKPRLTIVNAVVPYININLIDANGLKQHPYIKWNLAAAIVAYRNQHGNYENLEDLKKIELVTDNVQVKSYY